MKNMIYHFCWIVLVFLVSNCRIPECWTSNFRLTSSCSHCQLSLFLIVLVADCPGGGYGGVCFGGPGNSVGAGGHREKARKPLQA